MNVKLSPEAEAWVAEMTEAVKPMVQRIEASLPVTKYHYGEYMAGLSRMGEATGRPGPSAYALCAMAFVRAGANKQGVAHALKAMGVL